MEKATLAYYNYKKVRVLILHSHDPRGSAAFAIKRYNLNQVSFINVFKQGSFLYRMYVRNGQLVPGVGFEYDLSIDPYLKHPLVSERPLCDQGTYLSLVAEKIPGLSAIFHKYFKSNCQ